jgi:hypothetical protein
MDVHLEKKVHNEMLHRDYRYKMSQSRQNNEAAWSTTNRFRRLSIKASDKKQI